MKFLQTGPVVRSIVLISMLIATILAIRTLSVGTSQQDSSWQKVADIPTSRSEISAAASGGKIYIAGGIGPLTRSSFEVYDPQTNDWEKLPSLPKKRHHVATTAYQGAIYAAGGYSNLAFKPSANSWRYDIGKRSWQEIAPMQQPRGEHVLVLVDDHLYVLAGSGPHSSVVWRYSPALDQWKQFGQPMPTPRNSVAAVVHGPFVYVLGGRQRGVAGDLTTVERFDSRDGSWLALAAIPEPRAGHAAAIVGGNIFLFGGEALATSIVHSEVYRYDITANRWQPDGQLPTARHGLAGIAIEDTIYAISGSTKAGLRTPFSLTSETSIYSPELSVGGQR